MVCRKSCVYKGAWKHLLSSLLPPVSGQIPRAGTAVLTAGRLVWGAWPRKGLRQSLQEDGSVGYALLHRCRDLPAWLGCRDSTCLWWLSGDRGWGLSVQCRRLSCGCDSWGLQEDRCLQIIIELSLLEGLFAFLSVAVMLISGMPQLFTFHTCLLIL